MPQELNMKKDLHPAIGLRNAKVHQCPRWYLGLGTGQASLFTGFQRKSCQTGQLPAAPDNLGLVSWIEGYQPRTQRNCFL